MIKAKSNLISEEVITEPTASTMSEIKNKECITDQDYVEAEDNDSICVINFQKLTERTI